MEKWVYNRSFLYQLMRFSLVQALFTLLLSSIAFARDGNAQEILSQRITLRVDNERMRSVLQRIEKTAQISFMYQAKVIGDNPRLSLSASNETLGALLDQLLLPRQLRYDVVGRQIVISRQRPDQSGLDGPALPADNLAEAVADVAVSGQILDENNTPLPGATILLKGTSVGTSTNANGEFTLRIPDNATRGTLVISSVGYITQEVAIGNRTQISVSLQPQVGNLSEVVVVGYGTQQRRDLTGAISTVTARDIEKVPVVSLDQALQGRAAGVQVVNNSGAPGGAVQIRVRGTGSIYGGNDPLYVVDGVPINNTLNGSAAGGNDLANGLASINPADIESMEILKDASATAIYGARAANGVVLITTKRGKTGKTRVSLNTFTGLQNFNNFYPMLNARQFAELVNEGSQYAGRPPRFTTTPTQNTDWQREIFRTAPLNSVNLSVTGGDEKTQFLISAGYFNQQGVIINSGFSRGSFRANIDHRLSQKVKVGVSLTGASSITNRQRNSGGANVQDVGNVAFGPNIISSALVASPAFPVYNADGSFGRDSLAGGNNPVQLALNSRLLGRDLRFIGNVYAEWDILKGLKFRSNVGGDFSAFNEDFFFPPDPNAGRPGGTAIYSNSTSRSFLNENYLSYATRFAKEHTLDALAGFSIQNNNSNYLTAQGSNFTTPLVSTLNGASQFNVNPFNDVQGWGILSYFGRVNYSFRDKFLLTANARVDGSSRFGPDRQYGFFPSGSVGYRLSEEAFLKGVPWISEMKIRASVGVTGNQEIPNSQWRGTFALGGGDNNYLGRLGGSVARLANPSLSWESNLQTDIGLDVSLLSNRIQFTADWFNKQSRDMLLSVALPLSSGFGSVFSNVGRMQNRGLELALTTRNTTGKFKWETNFNIAFIENKVLTLADSLPIRAGANTFQVGSGMYFAVFDREPNVDPATGFVVRRNINNDRGNDGTPIFDDRDLINAGSPLPVHFGGITNTFNYAGFDLSIFFQWSYGNKIYNTTRQIIEELTFNGTVGSFNNSSTEALTRWRQVGDVTAQHRVSYDAAAARANLGYASTRYVEDGSFLRLKNLNFGYTIPGKLTNKLKMSSVRVYVTANNLLTFTNYKGYDPEVSANFGGSTQTQQSTVGGLGARLNNNLLIGVDNGSFPQTRTFLAGLNINF
ncbi:SusC/RagA family TonB-linked outer membrane protein [Spirosoma montaniterrae]|uniref:TonB-dependent receptor plug domain-containing protein n=1 Tax=Spirosoma montaniterrae TaxID=1178516 RepID=A0A1P9WV91_9BACT|nr:TonB-dependent receptor [Spirosoma montaniterrae]AQG79279.1 hypothetical protein AWR27_08035 [Spirosoma montaniterrae]